MELKEVIDKSLSYIDNNLETQLSIIKIASYFGYSEYYFSRMFKEQIGISVMKYVQRRRLIKASNEIIKGQKIIDAAFQCGWLSHSGFTKAFQQEFGFTPALLKVMIIEIDQMGGCVMDHVFMSKTKEHATKEELYAILIEAAKNRGDNKAKKNLEHVYQFACKVYKGIKRYSGDEYITHPLNVAILLQDMEADYNVVCAGMLCDVFEKTALSVQQLKEEVPEEVTKIVLALKEFDAEQIDIIKNEKEVMVKLAERLHNMRTIEFIEEEKRKVKAKETIKFYMPLARKLGNKRLIEELNDLALDSASLNG